jgi:hypothetical protein
MNIPYKKIELLANVAIIAVAVLLGAALVRQYLLPGGRDSAASPRIQKGATVAVPGVDWSKSNRTLILALQKGCHFCTESAPFYKRLAPAASEKNVRVVAVLPQSPEVGRGYMADLGVPVSEVAQASLDSISVSGTPTLILVDDKGAVLDSWVGKLPAAGEDEVLSLIGSASAR